VAAFSAAYALNMYFQSYGAVSIIKVKAYWFHVRERGVFGAIFGALISIGSYFAFDWGQAIVTLTGSIPAVFFIPAAIIAGWSVTDIWAVRLAGRRRVPRLRHARRLVWPDAHRALVHGPAEEGLHEPAHADDRRG